MAKSNKRTQSSKRIIYILSAVTIIFTVLLLVLLIKQTMGDNRKAVRGGNAVNVELGSYQYDIQGTKSVKISDENVTSLKTFLTNAAQKDISANCTKSYYWVTAFSDDRQQVLLNYGCENPGSRMFAVRNSGAWKFISPTNQFDTFGIPQCSHVDDNSIATNIAPVCYSETTDTERPLQYQVR